MVFQEMDFGYLSQLSFRSDVASFVNVILGFKVDPSLWLKVVGVTIIFYGKFKYHDSYATTMTVKHYLS